MLLYKEQMFKCCYCENFYRDLNKYCNAPEWVHFYFAGDGVDHAKRY